MERLEQRRGLGGQMVCRRDRNQGSARLGQGKTGRGDACATLGGQGVDRNKLAKVLVLVFPTIALLRRADKDLPAGLGLAKRLQIHPGNVAYPILRGREQAETGSVPPLLPAGAARGLRKDHDVLTRVLVVRAVLC
jgi:hypothetical protein